MGKDGGVVREVFEWDLFGGESCLGECGFGDVHGLFLETETGELLRLLRERRSNAEKIL